VCFFSVLLYLKVEKLGIILYTAIIFAILFRLSFWHLKKGLLVLKRVRRGILKKVLNEIEGYVCIFTLLVMSVVIFWGVVCRYVLHSSLPWSEEMARYLLVWTTFLGGAYGVRLGAHIGVEAFTLLLPKKVQAILHIIVMICCALLCVLIFKFGCNIVATQLAKHQLSPAMRIPMGYMYSAIPIGMVFFVIRYIQSIVEAIKDLKNVGKKEEAK
jgi:C4-dicarboxylate transporter DctQ subunit